MKVLLQNAITREYYAGENAWTQQDTDAFDFRALAAAARKAQEREREDLNVVLHYENPRCDLAINPVFCLYPPVFGYVHGSQIGCQLKLTSGAASEQSR